MVLLSRQRQHLNSSVEVAPSCRRWTTTCWPTRLLVSLWSVDVHVYSQQKSNQAQVHVVQFDGQGKISQIRLYWDQSTVLRQVDAIGKSGRNWPIRDGFAQVKTVKASINDTPSATNTTSLPSRSAPIDNAALPDRPILSPGARQDGDFNDRLFATGDSLEPRRPSNNTNPEYAVRASAKPAPRQLNEIFTDENSKKSFQPEGKPKIGSAKNFHENRLFDENKEPQPEVSKKTDPTKFSHFEFPNGESGAAASDMYRPMSNKTTKQSNWDFQDFSTPEKHRPRANPEQERHIGPGLDEVCFVEVTASLDTTNSMQDQVSPEKRPITHAARHENNAHFEIADDSPAGPKAPFSNKTNVDQSRRGDEYQPHFEIGEVEAPKKIYKTAGNGMGGRAGTRTLWDEPEPPTSEQAIYKTYGNGMGGRRDGGLSWDIGDEGDSSRQPAIYKTRGDGMGGRRDKNATTENDTVSGAKGYASAGRAMTNHSFQREDEYEF
jgi:hypothetical protein